MSRQIRLMAEYDTDALWSLDPASLGPIDPSSLPVSEETIERIRGWAKQYDEQLNREDPRESHFFNEERAADFDREGLSLWIRLRSELPRDWTVEYYSIRLQRNIRDPSEIPDG